MLRCSRVRCPVYGYLVLTGLVQRCLSHLALRDGRGPKRRKSPGESTPGRPSPASTRTRTRTRQGRSARHHGTTAPQHHKNRDTERQSWDDISCFIRSSSRCGGCYGRCLVLSGVRCRDASKHYSVLLVRVKVDATQDQITRPYLFCGHFRQHGPHISSLTVSSPKASTRRTKTTSDMSCRGMLTANKPMAPQLVSPEGGVGSCTAAPPPAPRKSTSA